MKHTQSDAAADRFELASMGTYQESRSWACAESLHRSRMKQSPGYMLTRHSYGNFISPDDPDAVARARGVPKRPGLIARLFGRGQAEPVAPPAPARLVLADGEGEIIDVDKAWHGIHYLLTGTVWEGNPPLNFLVTGGRDVGDEEIGLAPPRTLTAIETHEIANALAALSDDDLRARYTPSEMMRLEIYPEIWDRDSGENNALDYLMEALAQLRGGLARVVARGHGLLVTIS